MYDKIWLVVNKEGKFLLYNSPYKPTREKVEVLEEHPLVYREISTGKFIERWKYEWEMIEINKNYLDSNLRFRTWVDEPLLISK